MHNIRGVASYGHWQHTHKVLMKLNNGSLHKRAETKVSNFSLSQKPVRRN